MSKTIKSDYVVYLDNNYKICETSSNSRYVVQLDNLRFNISSVQCSDKDDKWTVRCRPTKMGQIEHIDAKINTDDTTLDAWHSRYYSINGGIYDEFTYTPERTILGERRHSKKGRAFFDKTGKDITTKIQIHVGSDIQEYKLSREEKFQIEVLHGDVIFLEQPRIMVDSIVVHFENINNVIKEYYKCKKETI